MASGHSHPGPSPSLPHVPPTVECTDEDNVEEMLAEIGGVPTSSGSTLALGAGSEGADGWSGSHGQSASGGAPSPRLLPKHTPPMGIKGGYERGAVISTSWDNLVTDEEEVEENYPSSAAEILPLLQQEIAVLSGGRDRQGQSIITFPSQAKNFDYERDTVRRLVQYLARIPTEDVREHGFSVIIDARTSNWHNTKLLLRTLQEALPGQIHVAYIVQPGHFWQKKATTRGHSKEKAKLEFSTVMLSAVEKLIRHVDSRQLTSHLGGFLPYNHEEWVKLRLDLEHFISSFNALMEHTSHVEQQLRLDQESNGVEMAEVLLATHIQMQDQLKKAPQGTVREGNELLKRIEQGRDEAGASSMTPDKINAVDIIKRLLENITRRQLQLEDLWREKKTHLEQTLQLRVFEKAMVKVRGWLKGRGEEFVMKSSDIGDSVETAQALEEQHEKFEAKARNMYNSLTQLRRMADRFVGSHHFASESLQRQVSKLSAKFTKFESLLAERRNLVHGSVRLHCSVQEWTGHYSKTSSLLKQDVSASDLTNAEQLLGEHNEMMLQLGQMADSIVGEGRGMLELMEAITRRSTENRGSGGSRMGPEYTSGISRVDAIVEEVDERRKRLNQLAEAKRLRVEQFKQLYSCEKDAKQVTQWLEDMRQQMASSHGDIGDSKRAVAHLLNEHEKFSETAKKTYKYGCDLLAAAQRTRRASKLEVQPNMVLLDELGIGWEKLSVGMSESRARLEIAQQFHCIADEVTTVYSQWTLPLQKLSKSPQAIEEQLRDIADNKDSLRSRLDECIRIAGSLLDRMCHPLAADPVFHTLNDNTKRSLTYLRAKLEELERKQVDLGPTLARQEALLKDFLTYCEFEQNIEQVLVWLQEEGLRKIQTFSHIGEAQVALQAQLADFQVFNSTCKEYSHQVDRLRTEAPKIESQIHGFKSDLGKKTVSLQAVWEKFLQRVEDREKLLHQAVSFYEGMSKVQDLLGKLEAGLQPDVVAGRGKGLESYLQDVAPRREKMLSLYGGVVSEGESLCYTLKRTPGLGSSRGGGGDSPRKIEGHLRTLHVHRKHVDELWERAWQVVRHSKQKAHPPQKEPFKSLPARPEPIGQSPENITKAPVSAAVVRGRATKDVVSKAHSDRYKALERQALQHLESLESDCSRFLSRYTNVGDSLEEAERLKAKYERLQQDIKPASAELTQTVKSLLALKSSSPLLSPGVDKLCETVKLRVGQLTGAVRVRWEVLEMFINFCEVDQKANTHLQALDDFLCQPLEEPVIVETAQQLLDKYQLMAKSLKAVYPSAKSLGEKFLEVSTQLLAESSGPRLSIGDASTSVAVEMGELEAKYPDVIERWEQREKELRQKMDWQGFKVNCDQISLWLKDSAEMFLESRVDLGTSLETAEDLLMELAEFQTRAKRIAQEVKGLLSQSDHMQAAHHFASAEVRERAWALRNLHGNFQSRLESREKALNDAIAFYLGAKQLNDDMREAIDTCRSDSDRNLPSKLKLSSVSTRLTNLQHEGERICAAIGSRPAVRSKKRGKITRSDSSSASELTLKQTLATLQTTFMEYKKALERRRVSPVARAEATKSRKSAADEVHVPAVALTKVGTKVPLSTAHKEKASAKDNSAAVDPVRKPDSKAPTVSTPHARTSSVSKPDPRSPAREKVAKSSNAQPLMRGSPDPKSPTKVSATTFDIGSPTRGSPTKVDPRASTQRKISTDQSPERRDKELLRRELKLETSQPPKGPSAVETKETALSRATALPKVSALAKATALPGTQLQPGQFRKTLPAMSVRERAAAFGDRPNKEKDDKNERPSTELKFVKEPVVEQSRTSVLSTAPVAVPPREAQPAIKQVVLQDHVSTSETPEFSVNVEFPFPTKKLKQPRTFVSSASRDIDPAFPIAKPRRRMSSSSSYVITSPEKQQQRDGSLPRQRDGSLPRQRGGSLPRQRAYTSPTVCKTTIKQGQLVQKPSFIRISVSSQKEGSPRHTATVPRTVVVSPTVKKPPASVGDTGDSGKVDEAGNELEVARKELDEARKGLDEARKGLEVADKGRHNKKRKSIQSLEGSQRVASLRSMFDQGQDEGTDFGPAPKRSRGSSSSPEPLTPPVLPIRSPDIAPKEEMMATLREEDTEDREEERTNLGLTISQRAASVEVPMTTPETATVVHIPKDDTPPMASPDEGEQLEGSRPEESWEKELVWEEPAQLEEASQVEAEPLEDQVISPSRPPLPELTPDDPPMRPPSPVGYYLERLSDSSEFESESDVFDSSMESGSQSSVEEDADDELTEEVDYGEAAAAPREKRVLRSMNAVLMDLLRTELRYLHSLETLVRVYLPAFQDPHLPTFLQGRKQAIFANVEELFQFHRRFYSELSSCEYSTEKVCQCFLRNDEVFLSYVHYVGNMAQGLGVLTQYGGTFFEDKQRELGDPVSLEQHYRKPKERLVQYDQLLKNLVTCAQKEYLHGVGITKDALRVIQRVLRAVDNAIVVASLKGCPFPVDASRVTRAEPFSMYTTHKKKHVRETVVVLHDDYIIFAQPHHGNQEGAELTTYEYLESLRTSNADLVETYKGRKDKFALCEGTAKSSSKFYVLQPAARDMVMKQLWVEELCAVLRKEVKDQTTPVAEEFYPLPISFTSRDHQSPREKESWFGSLRRRRSLKGRGSVKRSGSLKRSGALKSKDEVSDTGRGKEVRRLPPRGRRSRDSSTSETAGHDPSVLHAGTGGVEGVQLATLAGGQFRERQPEMDDDLYVVVRDFASEREGFLSVTKGQLVEVLDMSGAVWLVLTVPQLPGELETEGFLPGECLRLAGHAGLSRPTSKSSHASSGPSSVQPHDHRGSAHHWSGDPREPGLLNGSSRRAVSGLSSLSGGQTRSNNSEFISRLVEGVYYVTQPYTSRDVSLTLGQPVEVLDISSGNYWLVRTVDPQTGKPLEGMIPSSFLSPTPPVRPMDQLYEAETGQKVKQPTVSMESPGTSLNAVVPPPPAVEKEEMSRQVGDGNLEDSERRVPTHNHSDILSPLEVQGNLQSSSEAYSQSQEYLEDDTLHRYERSGSHPPLHHNLTEGSSQTFASSFPPEQYMAMSIQSLPATFSPVPPHARPPAVYLGYNPMEIPNVTLSQPALVPMIRVEEVEKMEAMEELRKLQEATVVQGSPSTDRLLEDFDPVEVYVAIADFDAVEESNISLHAGQCVQVLDSSRSDWWLVSPTDTAEEGWVPANYLEKRVIDGPSSPPPEPFVDETGELAMVMEKSRRPSVNRRVLYRSSFLAYPGSTEPEPPTDSQLEGVFSMEHPYQAVKEIQASRPGQLSLIQNQPVRVIDSKREDWWLVRTIPEDSVPPVEGWVPANHLQPAPYIREEWVEPPVAMAPALSVSPSAPPLWLVLADYQATESGMLTVHEGELVEVIDTSRNEWCLVRPSGREEEGWVPAAYLKPYDVGGYGHPGMFPQVRPHSSPEDSDTSIDMSDQLFSMTCISPEGVLMPYEEEEKREEARERRMFVLSELANSEREYVEKLQYCIETYVAAVDDPHAPKALKTLKDSLFGNLAQIYRFHLEQFLPRLVSCQAEPSSLEDVFVEAENQLLLYVTYCQNKSRSDAVYREFTGYFEDVSSHQQDRLKLPDYLILPVQRITKYSLLLQDFHKSSVRAGEEGGSIDSALEVTRGISTRANNAVHLSMMEGVKREFGELVLQGVFAIQEGLKQTLKERRVFLFDHALLITKKRREADKDSYAIKEQLMLTDISMTQDMDSLKRNIVIYDMLNGTKFILRAPKRSVRDLWLSKSNELIRSAKKEAAESQTRARSSSEPFDMLFRNSTRGSAMFRRDGSKRKSMKSTNSGSALSSRASSPTPEQQPPPGTEYVVMECIVMEGGDDVTLEPGDILKLVKVEGGGNLRVVTTDEHTVEGTVPESYLRKRDKGGTMDAVPKFTMTPSDMTQTYGSTATISAAFNGYPAPAVTWRKDREALESGKRLKITSCQTSSVLEIIQLEYGDTGIYTCFLTNSTGSDSASMVLSVHGPPSQPTKPSVSKVTTSSVKLKWPIPEHDGSSPILSYQIEILQDGFDEWQPIVQHPKNYFVVKTLEPSTFYCFRVIAYNEFGASKPSEPSDIISTKARGRTTSGGGAKGKSFGVHLTDGQDFPDSVFDDGDEGTGSPKPQFIRGGSVKSVYDVLPEEIGRGRFGIVYKCVTKYSGLQLAAKYVRLRSRKKPEIRREVEILLKLKRKSPHVLEFYDAFEMSRVLIIVTELVSDGELLERIIADNDLTEAVAVRYLSQLLSGVECLHFISVAHLDIKPENVLLLGGENPVVKLIDFGTARDLSSPDPTTPICPSSPEFCAPEVVNQEPPCLASDMWSVGVLTYVLLSGISPFFTENPSQSVTERIKEARYDFYDSQFEQISAEAKEFISFLLQKSTEYRMTASQALQHSWIMSLSRVVAGVASPWPMVRLDVSRLKAFKARRKWHTTAIAADTSAVFGARSVNLSSSIPPELSDDRGEEASPQLWDGPAQLRASIGSSVTFQFQVSGIPEPSVVWEHENRKLEPSSRLYIDDSEEGVTSLTITEVSRGDEGSYVCCAVNGLGSAVAETQLTVLDKPGPPSDVNGVILGSYNSALISWLPPAWDGNSNVSKYILERRRVDIDEWEVIASDLDSTAHVVEDLLPSVSYIFRVSAVNEAGYGPHSKPSDPVTIPNEPGYDSDSPSLLEEVRVKTTPFKLEYTLGPEISRGIFSVVKRCTENTTDRVFAAKMILGDTVERQAMGRYEYEVHRQLVHPRIVTLEDAFQTDTQTILVLEHMPGGTIQSLVARYESLPEEEVSRFTVKIVEGLQYLHDMKIIHVDLTPDNLLLSADQNDVKIADFGMARYIEAGNQLEEVPDHPDFMAPEAVQLQPLTTAADIWSVGAIAYFMLTGRSAFGGPTPSATRSNIRNVQLITESEDFWSLSPDCKDFLTHRVLVKNPRRRLTANQCQRHRWLQAGRRPSLERQLDHFSPTHRPAQKDTRHSGPLTQD